MNSTNWEEVIQTISLNELKLKYPYFKFNIEVNITWDHPSVSIRNTPAHVMHVTKLKGESLEQLKITKRNLLDLNYDVNKIIELSKRQVLSDKVQDCI